MVGGSSRDHAQLHYKYTEDNKRLVGSDQMIALCSQFINIQEILYFIESVEEQWRPGK
jgi:hypothetical protein